LTMTLMWLWRICVSFWWPIPPMSPSIMDANSARLSVKVPLFVTVNWPKGQLTENWQKRGKTTLVKFLFLGIFRRLIILD
jgi:hypothetical protein